MGDPAALSRPKAAGAQPVRARENNMREDTYRAAFAPERAAVSTTNVIMCGAAGMPACRKTLTKGRQRADRDQRVDRNGLIERGSLNRRGDRRLLRAGN